MGLQLAEGAVTALATYLSTNFAARVTALNTEYSDAVVLVNPAKYAVTEVVEADAYPVVEVLCDRTRIHGIGGGFIGSTHMISIICTVMDDSDVGEEKANLRKRVYRYARAIIELLRSAQAGGIPTYGIQLPTELIDFSPTVRRRGTSQIMAACGVRVEMQIQEAG